MKYTIKPLEWVESNLSFGSLTPTSSYVIWPCLDGSFEWGDLQEEDMKTAPASSLSEAKAACQKHWEEQLMKYLIEAECPA